MALLSVVYCLPRHPSAGSAHALDAVLHVTLFACIGAWFCRYIGRNVTVILPLLFLGAGLEVLQWRIGGYARIEWPDILANQAGVLLGAVLTRWRRSR